MALWNKRWTSAHLTQSRNFFERALALEPDNVEALVGIAMVDSAMAGFLLADDPDVRFPAAEAILIKALSLEPQHARAHLCLGGIKLCTNRAGQGVAECNHALILNPNLAEAHASIGVAKIFVGRAIETEAHILEALRVSPRDEGATRWMCFAGLAKLHLGANAEATEWLRRGLKANPNYHIVVREECRSA